MVLLLADAATMVGSRAPMLYTNTQHQSQLPFYVILSGLHGAGGGGLRYPYRKLFFRSMALQVCGKGRGEN